MWAGGSRVGASRGYSFGSATREGSSYAVGPCCASLMATSGSQGESRGCSGGSRMTASARLGAAAAPQLPPVRRPQRLQPLSARRHEELLLLTPFSRTREPFRASGASSARQLAEF
eukprot:4896092-Prymnesium_polylepis.1